MKYYYISVAVAGYYGSILSVFLPGVSGYDLGASCEYDLDCVADHSFCQMQRTCQCKRGFVAANDGSTCLANVGASCRSRYDCVTLPHSDCFQDVCQCEPDFVPDITGSQCLPRVKDMRGSCEQDNQCQVSFGDQSHCFGGRCECMMRHHYLNGRCYLTRDINEFCSNSSECYIGPDYTTTVECRDQRCQCIRGYYVNQYRKCIRSTATQTCLNHIVFIACTLAVHMFPNINVSRTFLCS